MIKKTVFILYCAVIACMAAATIVENCLGTEFTHMNIYGSWWFSLLWGALAGTGIFYFISRKVRRVSVVALHVSFVIILIGALITHLSAKQGYVHLRMGDTVYTYYVVKSKGEAKETNLPFSLELTSFNIKYHSGTDTPADYKSEFVITENNVEKHVSVSMNNICSYRSYRIYQSSFDPDMRGSILAINYDPAGIPITYAGYFLLFLSLIWILIDSKGPYRKILRSNILKKGFLLFIAFFLTGQKANAAPVLPKETANEFGRMYILYNGRICPMQTFALDFTKKLCGKAKYKNYTAEQVLTGFIFYAEEWSNEPIMKLKSGVLQKELDLPEYTSANSFFKGYMNSYILGPYIQEYYNGTRNAVCKQAVEIDERLQLIMELNRGTLLKIFPVTNNGETAWYSPIDEIPSTVDTLQTKFMQNVLRLISQEARNKQIATVNGIIEKLQAYQKKHAGNSLPTPLQTRAERIYNAVPFATVLFIANLTLGLLSLIFFITATTRSIQPERQSKVNAVFTAMMCISFALLTLCLTLRWIVSKTIPMSNGYETMLTISWVIMAATICASHRFRIVITFGFILSGLFLLVSHIGQMNPQINHIMPVLSSPLLSIHVSVIMVSFALLSFTFICGLTALIINLINKGGIAGQERIKALQMLSQLFLYPAITTLGIGIFVGAIWANVSWGTYWSWDPKEVWALITFMIYAIALHKCSIPMLNRPMTYHIFMVIAFLSIIMTYFGVNYLLGGMHSYA